jgi:hypothetical protein
MPSIPSFRSRRSPLTMLLAIHAFQLAAVAQTDTVWMRLGNGKDLAGWKYNPAYFKVDSGMIVARGESSTNQFCYRPETFSDFELRFRARLFEQMGYANAGVQYRSRLTGQSTKDQVQGYQLELGANGCGGFYNEGGYPTGPGLGYHGPSQDCLKAIRKNDWNDYAVIADGGKISHWLNGKKCYEMTDASVLSGVIASQLHKSSTGIMEADYKDFLIRPLHASFTIPDSLAVHTNAASSLLPKNRSNHGDPRVLRILPAVSDGDADRYFPFGIDGREFAPAASNRKGAP